MIAAIHQLKLRLLDLFATKGTIKVSLPSYQIFYRAMQEFVGKYKLYDDADWKVIEENLIHKGCEYLSFEEAREIKLALDRVESRLMSSGQDDKNTDFIYEYLHPTVCELARPRMESKCYADAVESVFKAINCRVKKMVMDAKRDEKDGAALMQFALSGDCPLVRLTSSLIAQSDKDIQRGYQFLFAGAMMAIRNPKAHDNVTISKVEAFRFLMFASTLMAKLDGASVGVLDERKDAPE